LVDLRRLLDPRRRWKAKLAAAPENPMPVSRPADADRFDAARERLRSEIPPPADDD